MINISLAGEVIYYLSKEAKYEYRHQNRVGRYFVKINGYYTVNINSTGTDGNSDNNMNGIGGSERENITMNTVDDHLQPYRDTSEGSSRDCRRNENHVDSPETPLSRREKIYLQKSW